MSIKILEDKIGYDEWIASKINIVIWTVVEGWQIEI